MSAILFLAAIVFWVRSLGHTEHWSVWREGFERDGPQYFLGTSHVKIQDGRLWIEHGLSDFDGEIRRTFYHERDVLETSAKRPGFSDWFSPDFVKRRYGFERRWNFLGVGFRRYYHHDRLDEFTVAVPFGLLATIFGLWPGLVVTRRLLRGKRYAEGLCPSCGYDLRATPQRCPECGRVKQV